MLDIPCFVEEDMKNIIVGTSGHIDHGKTTLVKALTGRDTDTLEEEKKRGISINLGFTYFDLPNGDRVGIVDVPGHERFIKNMLAGASGIDLVLLVIAADEGVMPQTIEHVDILTYMNITKGIIVLTKCDMVEDEFIELVKEDVHEKLIGTFLEDADIVEVDSVSKRGIDKLIDLIQKTTSDIEEKNETSPARLNIDRVFSVKGFGTVVTGTLLEGIVNLDDELELYPSRTKVKVRNIQVHGQNEKRAFAGQRTAINISNVKKDDVSRGDVLAKPGTLEESMMIDVKIKMTNHTEYTIKHWSRLRLFHGTREIFCRAVPLESDEIKTGEEGFAQLRLEEKIICKKGDKFVLRSYSPVDTIGGGVIIDTASKKHKIHDEDLLEVLKIKEQGELKDIIEEYIRQNSDFYPDIKDIMAYSGEHREDIEAKLRELIEEKKIIKLSQSYIHVQHYEHLKERAKNILGEYHRDNKLKHGMQKEELRSKLDQKLKTKDIDLLLRLMVDENTIKEDKNTMSLNEFEVKLTPEQKKIKSEIENTLLKSGLTQLYTISEIASLGKNHKAVLETIIDDEVILLDNQYIIHRKDYDRAKEILVDYLKENQEITLGEYRDLVNSSRKNCMIILEFFDKENLTRRVENKRVLV